MKPTKRRIAVGLLATACAATLAAGCGDDEDKGASATQDSGSTAAEAPANSGSQTIALAADPDGAIAFDKKELTAKAGPATIAFENASQTPHAVEVEGNGLEEETKTITGGKADLKLDLKPGTYEFYCPVGNHEQEGMKGVLKVQ